MYGKYDVYHDVMWSKRLLYTTAVSKVSLKNTSVLPKNELMNGLVPFIRKKITQEVLFTFPYKCETTGCTKLLIKLPRSQQGETAYPKNQNTHTYTHTTRTQRLY